MALPDLECMDIDINIVFNTSKIRQYFCLKDKTDSILRSSVVYRFQCSGDPSSSYIGKTKRYLQNRISEHSKSGSSSLTYYEL